MKPLTSFDTPCPGGSTSAELLSALTAYMTPEEAADLLTRAIMSRESCDVPCLARALSAVASRMEPAEAAHHCKLAAETLTCAIGEQAGPKQPSASSFAISPSSPQDLSALAEGLAVLSARLESMDSDRLCTLAVKVLGKALVDTPPNDNPFYERALLSVGFSALARRVPDKAADVLLQGITPKSEPKDLQWLAQQLALVTAPMKPETAAAYCKAAAEVLLARRQTSEKIFGMNMCPINLPVLAQGLLALADRMEPADAVRTYEQTGKLLTETITDPSIPVNNLAALAQGLAAVADRLDSDASSHCCKAAADALLTRVGSTDKNARPQLLADLTPSVVALASHVPPTDAAQSYERTAEYLVGAIADPATPALPRPSWRMDLLPWRPG